MEVCVKEVSHPLPAAVTADSLRKVFDVGMEEPVGETHITGLLMHPRVGNKSRAISDLFISQEAELKLCSKTNKFAAG